MSEAGKKHLNAIIGSAKKMSDLIDDLLSFSKTGRIELKKTTLNMNQVIEDSLVQFKPSTIDRKIEWKISELPEVFGDYSLMRLVWNNLIDNAIKYTGTKEKAVIQIGFSDEKREIVFFIKDNGIGFDMKYADKLFGVFQRLHSSSQFEGTGVGLANIRRIIVRHGGRTWAEAKPNQGATFYYSVPKRNREKK
jgi:light-regulated signal transduction histidine kinase (bacteriophytochrome)